LETIKEEEEIKQKKPEIREWIEDDEECHKLHLAISPSIL